MCLWICHWIELEVNYPISGSLTLGGVVVPRNSWLGGSYPIHLRFQLSTSKFPSIYIHDDAINMYQIGLYEKKKKVARLKMKVGI